jgi:hypothetical protein
MPAIHIGVSGFGRGGGGLVDSVGMMSVPPDVTDKSRMSFIFIFFVPRAPAGRPGGVRGTSLSLGFEF